MHVAANAILGIGLFKNIPRGLKPALIVHRSGNAKSRALSKSKMKPRPAHRYRYSSA